MDEDTGAGPGAPSEQTQKSTPVAGWYSDPAGSGGTRYWNGSRWTADTKPPAAAAPEGTPSTGAEEAARAVAESTARMVMFDKELRRQRRSSGFIGKAQRAFGWFLLVVVALSILGGISNLLNGGGSHPASTAQTDPCSTVALMDGQQTIAQYKRACPQWHSYATTTYPTTVSANSPVGLDGAIFGGTETAWKAEYTPDPNVEDDAALDPSPGSFPDSTDRFTSVDYDNGRVDELTEALPADTSIHGAVTALKQMLPRDAKLGPVVVLDACAAMSIQSATLKSEIDSPNSVAFFDSGTDGDSYNPADVGEFSIAADETVPSSC